MGEAGLELRFADLLVAGAALMAVAAAGNERHGDTVAGLEAGDVLADCGDDAGEFVAGNMRQADIRIMPHPAVPVAAAEAGRLYLDDHAAIGRFRIGQGCDNRGLAEQFVKKRAHHGLISLEGGF
ncbi:hypothetical protein D3C80_1163650 [compost metagenome]